MEAEEQFTEHLEVIGRLPSAEGRKNAVISVFTAMKSKMSDKQAKGVREALPEWLQAAWDESGPFTNGRDKDDVLSLIKSYGGYSYGGAAKHALEAVFAALVETTDERTQQALHECLPTELLPFWSGAQECSLGKTMGEFL
jgi:uncharacterized protein (DUF2267 family)